MYNSVKLFFIAIFLLFVQVLVLNQVSVFGYATPLLFVYFIVKLPLTLHRNWVLLLAFGYGMVLDAFTQSYGLQISALVTVAFLRPYVVMLFVSKDEAIDNLPSANMLGWAKFYRYAGVLVLLNHLWVAMLNYWEWQEAVRLTGHALLSSLITMVLVVACEGIWREKNERH